MIFGSQGEEGDWRLYLPLLLLLRLESLPFLSMNFYHAGEAVEGEGREEEMTGGYLCCSSTAQARKSSIS